MAPQSGPGSRRPPRSRYVRLWQWWLRSQGVRYDLQRHPGPGPGGVPSRGDLFQITVGNEPQHHGVAHADVTAEGASETDPIYGAHTHLVHQELDAGVEGCFGELNLSRHSGSPAHPETSGSLDGKLQYAGERCLNRPDALRAQPTHLPRRPRWRGCRRGYISATTSIIPEPQILSPGTVAARQSRARLTTTHCRCI
ncbi:MAG: hypothetical protein CM15mP84_00460 [Cellvibrionales bacterium]|nr:MAG: hypothetical protein CM15mP84_00460 [Cellvibrionales bacterium]